MGASTSDKAANSSLSMPLLLTPEQAAASLSICRTRIYELLRSGELRSVQIGMSRRIPVADLEATSSTSSRRTMQRAHLVP
jgi:excisionase family DNA binding protein